MATIRSQLVLTDGMSAPLKRINKALNICLNSFESIQTTSGRAVNTQALEQARRELGLANRELDSMQQSTKNLNETTREGLGLADSMLGKIVKMAAGYLSVRTAVNFVKSAIEDANEAQRTSNQLAVSLKNMGMGGNDYTKLTNAASRYSAYTKTAMTAAAAEFSTYMTDSDAIEAMMGTLANYMVGMSNGSELDTKAVTDYATQLGKVLNGTFDGIAKKGFQVTDAQKEIIKTGTDMEKVAAAAEIIDEAWAGLYDTWERTPYGQMLQVKNAFAQIKTELGAGLLPTVLAFVNTLKDNMPTVNTVVQAFGKVIAAIAVPLNAILRLIGRIADYIVNNWSWIEPIIWGIVAALIAYNTVQGEGLIATLASTASKIAHAVASGAETLAIIALIAAQEGLNAALAACPLTWILIAIIAVIAGIVALVRALDIWGAKSTSVIGTITGLIAVAGAFVYNLALGVLNGMIELLWSVFVYPFIGIIEWVLNIANGGFNSFGDAVANLIGNIIGWFLSLGKVVTKIIDAIFGTNWTAGLTELQNKVTAWGKNENAITLDRTAPTIGNHIAYGNAFSTGAAFGDGISSKLGGLFGADETDVESLFTDVGDISDSADGIAGSVDGLTEDLKYLRDLAEQEAVNKFTTAKVEIDFSGMTNRIDSQMDLDGVISTLTEGFAEALEIAAEGVHE